MKRISMAILLTVWAAALAACGGGGTSGTRSTTTETAAPSTLALNTGPAPWPRPDHVMERVAAAGLPGFTSEKLFFHVHAHLDVFVDGRGIPVPAGIGIRAPTTLPKAE